MNWSWGKYRARCCFLGRFTFDDPQFTASACPLLIVLRVSLIRGTSSIIKRRYLFSQLAKTYGRSFIDVVPFPQAVISDVLQRKKCYRPASRILHDCRRDTDRATLGGQRDRYSSSVFDVGPVCRQNAHPRVSRDDFSRCPPRRRGYRRPCCVVV